MTWAHFIDRSLYAGMAAMLVVPEPATFLLFSAVAVAIGIAGGRFAWNLLRDDDASWIDAGPSIGALREPAEV